MRALGMALNLHILSSLAHALCAPRFSGTGTPGHRRCAALLGSREPPSAPNPNPLQQFLTQPLLQASKELNPVALQQTLTKMFLYSAALGPCLDNYHGLFDVLNYKQGVPIVLTFNDHTVLKTAAWVPFLFGFAGVSMSFIVLTLDSYYARSSGVRPSPPSWSKVLYGISFFSAQYYLSGLLDKMELDIPRMHASLLALLGVGSALFDASAAGLLLGLLTAAAGTGTELLLVNALGLYSYTHADVSGVCSWIPWVYFLGAFAVGNLARKVYSEELTRVP